MSENLKPSQPSAKVGLEEFLEDVFGLNIRSAKTIWAMFKTPRIYFEAAKTPDWRQDYTPSLRLWLGLMAIMVALQFIWASPDGAIMEVMRQSLEGGLKSGAESRGEEVDISKFDFDGALTSMMKFNTLIYPFIFVGAMSFLALVYRAWGEKLSYVVRQRYIFAVIVPATCIGLVSTILMTFLDSTKFAAIGLIQTLVIVILYFMTAYRGPYAHMKTGEKFGRSFFLAVCIILTLMIAQIISYTIAMFVKLAPALRAYLQTAGL